MQPCADGHKLLVYCSGYSSLHALHVRRLAYAGVVTFEAGAFRGQGSHRSSGASIPHDPAAVLPLPVAEHTPRQSVSLRVQDILHRGTGSGSLACIWGRKRQWLPVLNLPK